MHTYIGIWIDHAKAVLAKSNKLGEMTFEEFRSEVEPHHKGGHDDGEHQTIVNQNRDNERRHNQMKSFCKSILAHLGDADEIVIVGPGTAKHEFKNVLEDQKALASKLKGLKTADDMTEAKLKEFMKSFFHLG